VSSTPYDPKKMRRLDPELAEKLERVLADKAKAKATADTSADRVSQGARDAGTPESPATPSCPAEAPTASSEASPPLSERSANLSLSFQKPVDASEGGAALPASEEGAATAGSSRSEASPSASEVSQAREVADLVASLATDNEVIPDCKRSAEELSLPTWQTKSSRREDAEFGLPAEFDEELRAMTDAELGSAWGWLTKRRYRGLSSRDLAVQQEVYARCLGILDLYGLGRQPTVSAMLEEALRSQGCRSGVALYIIALQELMLVRGRMALRLSASEAYALKGFSPSAWWAAVARLETMGILQRVRSVKPGEHGPAPVQRCTNLYVLGPWWFAGRKDKDGEPVQGTTPLELSLGLLELCVRREESPAATAALRRTLRPRRERRRARNSYNRDRNRRRHRGLPPRVTSTPEVVRAADVLARARRAQEEAVAESWNRRRAQAVMRGDLEGVGMGEAPPLPVPPCSRAAEVAAERQVAEVNRGEPVGAHLRQELAQMGGAARLPSRLHSEFANCRPVFGWQSRRGKPKEKTTSSELTSPSPRTTRLSEQSPDNPTHTPQDPVSRTKAGDKSTKTNALLGARTRALDGDGPTHASENAPDTASLQDDPIIREAFLASYGRPMSSRK